MRNPMSKKRWRVSNRGNTQCSCLASMYVCLPMHGYLQWSLAPVPGDPVPCDLYEHQACMQCTQMHSGRALLHIKNENKKSKLKAKISMTSLPFLCPFSQFRFRQCPVFNPLARQKNPVKALLDPRFLTRLLPQRKCPLRQDEAPS